MSLDPNVLMATMMNSLSQPRSAWPVFFKQSNYYGQDFWPPITSIKTLLNKYTTQAPHFSNINSFFIPPNWKVTLQNVTNTKLVWTHNVSSEIFYFNTLPTNRVNLENAQVLWCDNQPSTPFPTNQATIITIQQEMSWECWVYQSCTGQLSSSSSQTYTPASMSCDAFMTDFCLRSQPNPCSQDIDMLSRQQYCACILNNVDLGNNDCRTNQNSAQDCLTHFQNMPQSVQCFGSQQCLETGYKTSDMSGRECNVTTCNQRAVVTGTQISVLDSSMNLTCGSRGSSSSFLQNNNNQKNTNLDDASIQNLEHLPQSTWSRLHVIILIGIFIPILIAWIYTVIKTSKLQTRFINKKQL